MTNHEEVLELYDQYMKDLGWDRVFEAFFDPNNKTQLDEKAKRLRKCIKEGRIFSTIDGHIKYLDLYPTDIEEQGGHWDL